MLLQVILFCLLANSWFVESTDNVIANVGQSRSLLRKLNDEKIRRFWTPERLAAAKPMDLILPSSSNKTLSSSSNMTIGSPSSVVGLTALHNGTRKRAISRNGQQVHTTGKVFWQTEQGMASCSAAVVSSKSGDLIVTAAHCVYDTDTQTWFNNNNWVFIPAFSNYNGPYGTWTARSFLVNPAWISSGDYNYDVAFVALSTLNGRHIRDVVGAQGIAFNQPRSAYTYSFGYPSNLDSGLYLKSCVGFTRNSPFLWNNYAGQGLSCNMGRGCSGGPWMQDVDDATGIGYVTSVNSFTIDNIPNVMNGPYFETNIKSLYDQASSM